MNLNKSVSFEKIPAPRMGRSVVGVPFKNDFNAALGKIVPCYVADILPGTSVRMRSAAQIRLLQPFKVAMFDYMKAQFFWFFCPYRILSKFFTRFIEGAVGTDPDDTGESGQADPVDWNVDAEGSLLIPHIKTNGVDGLRGDLIQPGSLWDYMNMAGGVPKTEYRTANHFYKVRQGIIVRSYNAVYNWYFRDENLQSAKSIDFGNSYTEATNYELLDACKTRDMFTTALIKPQKANSVVIPGLQGEAPLSDDYVPIGFRNSNGDFVSKNVNFNLGTGIVPPIESMTEKYKLGPDSTVNMAHNYRADYHSGIATNVISDKDYPLMADLHLTKAILSSAEGISVQNLRLLVQVNKWTERLAIGGSRYGEVIQSFFGVNPGDKRLQQPQFLGVGTVDINVQEVINNTGFGDDLGATGGRSNSVAGAGNWFQSFSEHGVLLCVMVIRQKMNSYQQGQPRMYDKSNRLDMYWPTFGFIGFQPIKNRVIYNEPENVKDQKNDEVFGYNKPWIEYLQKPNEVHGDLLSKSSDTPLDFWNLAENFDSLPHLGSDFIKAHQNNLNRALLGEQSMERPFVVNFRTEAYYTVEIPINANPGYMDHF